jgi:hypothetical protein
MIAFPFIPPAFDADARAYILASGATARAEINHFVKAIKRLGLWNHMVCWPLRSAQNAGTGSTAYSLGGLGAYHGTLVNEPTWSVDGVVAATSNSYIQTQISITLSTIGAFSVVGVGNIYINESLFKSGISPLKIAKDLILSK